MAGVCGLDPRPLTLAELVAAADGRRSAAWDIGAALIWHTYNANKWSDKELPFGIDRFHPYRQDQEEGQEAVVRLDDPRIVQALVGAPRANQDLSRLPPIEEQRRLNEEAKKRKK